MICNNSTEERNIYWGFTCLGPGSRSSSTSSLNSIGTTDIMSLKTPLRDQQQINNLICTANSTNNNKTQSTIVKKPVSGNFPIKGRYTPRSRKKGYFREFF